MVRNLVLATMALLATTSELVYGSPSPRSRAAGQSNKIELVRRSRAVKGDSWFDSERETLRSKYNSPNAFKPSKKRSSGTNLLVNQNADSSYYGSLAIGTPPVSYNVILDTGSADLWIADSFCRTGCSGVPTFNAGQSTSFINKTTSFSIQYGSGSARGSLGQDIIQMAGFTVSNQIFGVCDSVSTGLLVNPVSGLLGLAFKTIASSRATPFWETLVTNGAWDSPLMAFHLTRYLDDPSAQVLEPGGSFTMGALDASLYTGSIDYLNIPAGTQSYWILPLTAMTVQGNSISSSAIGTSSSAYAAIDTGTTLVGGPPSAIAAIYQQIPGSFAGTGSQANYWYYPCSTTVEVTMTFGGQTWPISSADFLLQAMGNGQCIGAFFELTTGGSAPAWIVGDTFLKNVYSVFRYSPASIGFATLSSNATAQNGGNGPVPSATIGSATAAVSATGSSGSGGIFSGTRASAEIGIGGWLALVIVFYSAIASSQFI